MVLPRVILHTEVSVDGRMDWIQDDTFLYYRVIDVWSIDAMISGSATMLAAYPSPDSDADRAAPLPRKAEGLQRIVVVDSKGQIRSWRQIQRGEHWGDVTVLCSAATPQAYLEDLAEMGIDAIVTGDDHVDLRAALEELHTRYGIEVVRTDSGGILNGALLREGLVDEVSVLLCPVLVGGRSPRSFFVAPDLASRDGMLPLKLTHVDTLDDGVIWLRYQVTRV